MKIKKVLQICLKRGALELLAGDDAQWISDGCAMYPLWDFPPITPAELCLLHDINMDKQDKLVIRSGLEVPADIDTADAADGDEAGRTERMPLWIHAEGVSIVPYRSQYGLMWMDAAYLTPFAGEDGIDIIVRTMQDGQPYFAVKKGLMLVGIIMPYQIMQGSQFVRELEEIAALCRAGMESGE